jgi:hypothetical protein
MWLCVSNDGKKNREIKKKENGLSRLTPYTHVCVCVCVCVWIKELSDLMMNLIDYSWCWS